MTNIPTITFQMITALSIVITTILTILLLVNFRNKKCLPGPWNLPVIGYLHKLDPVAPYLTLTKLVQKYGPVYGIKLGSINVAVIADAKILKKVLAKDETLERPPLYMINTAFKHKGTSTKKNIHWKLQNSCRSGFCACSSMERTTQIPGNFFKNSRSR